MANAGLGWTSDAVKLTDRLVGQRTTALTDEQPRPYALVLLSPTDGLKVRSPLGALRIDRDHPVLRVDLELEKVIATNAVDAVIYGPNTGVDSCPVYSRLFPQLPEEKYVLRDYNFRRSCELSLLQVQITLGHAPDSSLLIL